MINPSTEIELSRLLEKLLHSRPDPKIYASLLEKAYKLGTQDLGNAWYEGRKFEEQKYKETYCYSGKCPYYTAYKEDIVWP